MAIRESELSTLSSISTSDYVRSVAGGASSKVKVSDLAKTTLEEYSGTSIAGANQSVKSAVDSLDAQVQELKTYVTPQMYGAKGNGIADDTSAIQTCLDENKGKTIFFPTGEYLISEPLVHWGAPQASSLVFNNARITASEAMTHMLLFGHNTSAAQDWEGYGIYGKAIFNCNNLASVGIRVDDYCFSADIKDVAIMDLPEDGIGLQIGLSGATAGAMVLTIDNLYVWSSVQRAGTIGIEVNGGDSYFNNIETQRTEIGILFKEGSNNLVENVHVFTSIPLKDQVDSSSGCGIANYTEGNLFTNLYVDNYMWGIRSTRPLVVNGYNYYLPSSINNVDPETTLLCAAVRSTIGTPNIINGLWIRKQISFVSLMCVYLSNLSSQAGFDVGALDLNRVEITATNTDGFQIYGDEAFNIRNNNRAGDIVRYGSASGLSAGHYLIGYLNPMSGYAELDFGISNDWAGTIGIKTARTSTPPITSAPTVTSLKKTSDASSFSLVIADTPINHGGRKYFPVYLKINLAVSYIFLKVGLRTWCGSNFYACHYENASKMEKVTTVSPMYTINFGDDSVS